MTSEDLYLIGPPGSGKTTFLAALWELLQDPEASTEILGGTLPADFKYLAQIHSRWLSCEKPERTSLQAVGTRVRLPIRIHGDEVVLDVPDTAGEAFARFWENGLWPDPYEKMPNDATGVLLFVNAGDVAYPTRLDADGEFDRGAADEPIPWKPQMAATQTQIAFLLESLRDQIEDRKIPLVLVISAWDLESESGLSPAAWVRINLPLVDQFLRVNSESFPNALFGISAQGGDFESEGVVGKLLEVVKPRDRTLAVASDGATARLTDAIEWFFPRLGE